MTHKNNNTKFYEDTICYKVGVCQKEIQRAVEKGNFDAGKVAQLLVNIQSDAIRMEEALKSNKVLRIKHHIDKEYREMMKEKFTAPGINNIEAIDTQTKEPPRLLLTLEDVNGKILYKNKLFAFIMCAVERIDEIDEAGMIDGQTQTLAMGNDIAVIYAYDQLKQKFAAKLVDLALKMAHTVRAGKFANRAERRKFLRAANGMRQK